MKRKHVQKDSSVMLEMNNQLPMVFNLVLPVWLKAKIISNRKTLIVLFLRLVPQVITALTTKLVVKLFHH